MSDAKQISVQVPGFGVVSGHIEGDLLILTINMSKAAMDKAEPSKSGKTKVLASTRGFTGFGPVKVSLNATI